MRLPAAVRFVVLFLLAEFCVLDAKYFFGCSIVVGLFVVYFSFLVVDDELLVAVLSCQVTVLRSTINTGQN